jgi:enoyl-CoA hydratase/carnithine racemase
MIRAIHDRLRTWEQSDSVKFIVFNGSGGKAFCAGGDLTQVTDAAEGQSSFIRPEYELDSYIANYPKPSIAIWDGITMGGGVGLTINCTHKVATDKFTFAMPEVRTVNLREYLQLATDTSWQTKLGFFPDVGATQFLTKLPHYVGKYVALLAGRLSSGDATFCQLAQYYMPSNRIPDLMTILSTRTIHNVSFDLPHILHSLHEDPRTFAKLLANSPVLNFMSHLR